MEKKMKEINKNNGTILGHYLCIGFSPNDLITTKTFFVAYDGKTIFKS
jgi:hypothetical protein